MNHSLKTRFMTYHLKKPQHNTILYNKQNNRVLWERFDLLSLSSGGFVGDYSYLVMARDYKGFLNSKQLIIFFISCILQKSPKAPFKHQQILFMFYKWLRHFNANFIQPLRLNYFVVFYSRLLFFVSVCCSSHKTNCTQILCTTR